MTSQAENIQKSFIWITGYSASGKTTIAIELVRALRAEGHVVVHLDGDELRAIFGKKWGHSREEKMELSLVYMRLSKNLAQQGQVVVLSAVAMFQEIYDWVSENVPNSLMVLVEAPLQTRVNRDAATKNVYSEINAQGQIYELPEHIDLKIANADGASISIFARKIANLIKGC